MADPESPDSDVEPTIRRMTLRDLFAGLALLGLRASERDAIGAEPGGCIESAGAARLSYDDADAMLNERIERMS